MICRAFSIAGKALFFQIGENLLSLPSFSHAALIKGHLSKCHWSNEGPPDKESRPTAKILHESC